MNICITGALGHIGSALIRNLTDHSFEKIYLVDNLSTQRYPSLFDLPKGQNYIFHELDILAEGMESIVQDSDILIHLAAVTNAEASFSNPELVDRVNKQGLEKIAKLCAKRQCALLFPSTTSVYGISEGVVDEDCSKKDLKPQSPYAESKLCAENLLKELTREERLRCVTFRLGTIFGYSIGMRFHTAVNKFIWQAAFGKEITVWKTALHQQRPYCGLQDCINAINYVIKGDLFNGELYNIVTTNLAVNDILKEIETFIPQLNIQFVDSPIMNQLSYTVSNEKSLKQGFQYRDVLKENIKRTLEKIY